jgi:DNA-binding response OmpR family regulator
MRVVVAVPEEPEGTQLTNVFRHGGHDVRTGKDEVETLAAVTQQPTDLVVLGAGFGESLLSTVKRIGELAPAPYVLVLHNSMADEALARLLEAGADGDLRRPLHPKVFHARVAAVQRRVATKAHPPAAPAPAVHAPAAPPAAHAPAKPLTPIEVAGRSATWSGAMRQLEVAAGKFLTLQVTAEEATAAPANLAVGASIVLLNAESQLELRIALAADVPSARSLAVHLFGDDGADMAGDVMTELANILMGTLKTSLSAENLPFTGGLPVLVPVEDVVRPPLPYKLQETVELRIVDARVYLHLGLRSRANVMLTPGALKEGHVLAKDVFNARGMLLINGGTRLSETMIERLRAAASPQQQVEVIAP